MLSKKQIFIKLMSVYVVGLAVLFAATVYLFDLSRREMLGLLAVAVVMLVFGAIRTWNNPNIHQ